MAIHKVFEYAVVRLVPMVEREEFMNIGVILFCKELDFIDVKYALNHQKIQSFAPQLDLQLLEEYLKSFHSIVKGKEEGGEIATYISAERFRWLTATRSTMIQCSRVHPGFCDHPELKLNQLFQEFV
jgi:hypothetical protein